MRKLATIAIGVLFLAGCRQDLEIDPSPWTYEQPQFIGADAPLLLKLDHDIQNNKFGNINSLMIVKGEHVIFENYYNGHSRNDLLPLNRASQSVMTLLLASAMEEASLGFSDKLIDLFPEYDDIFFNIPQKDKIEINHLLEHSSGFNWSEWNFNNMSPSNRAALMEESEDWVRFVLSTHMIREPGMEFNFNSGHAIVLSAALEKHLSVTLDEYFRQNLFNPLGISNYQWEKTPNQLLNTASGLKMTTSDMAKIGYLALKNGVWGNKQVISEEWIQEINKPIALSNYYSIGINWFKFHAFHPIVQVVRTNDIRFTWGEGGQFIFISPALETVIVITADNYANGKEFSMFYILRDYILPSLNETLTDPTSVFN